ncbi:DinB family protein [Ferrimicrobium acidiphilum]|uniref:DinB family protein n=1 Tax=Ferrimicrobium acidiphilum TaxID=121039 RepID=UPI0023F1E073|nr:DinB family protein [Ferrimicrobium acidiphilum]
MGKDLVDPRRSEPTANANERDMLEGWLNYHRVTLLLKCEGLDEVQLNTRPIPTSALSLHGLVRHMTEVEFFWTSTVLNGETGVKSPFYCSDEFPEADFDDLESAPFAVARDLWLDEQHRSDELMSVRSLDFPSIGGDEAISLRWILTHLIEEYARHNGHADLLRELIDGAVGC